MSNLCRALLAALLVAAASTIASAQDQSGFVGVWALTWQDPDGACPCTGTLTVDVDSGGDGFPLTGTWERSGPTGTLRGTMSLDRRYWGGSYFLADDGSGYIKKGFFRLELRDSNTLTGSYHREGTAIPFSWSGTRK